MTSRWSASRRCALPATSATPRRVDEVFALVDDADETVRRAALEHLPFIDDARALPRARRCARRRQRAQSARAAARALARVDAAEARAALIERAGRRRRRGCGISRHAASANSGIDRGGRAADAHGVRRPAPHVRIAALDALGALGRVDGASLSLKPLAARRPRRRGRGGARARSAACRPQPGPAGVATRRCAAADAAAPARGAVRGLAAHGSTGAVDVARVGRARRRGSDDVVGARDRRARSRRRRADARRRRRGRSSLSWRCSAIRRGASAPRRRSPAHRSTAPGATWHAALQHPHPTCGGATVDVLGRFQHARRHGARGRWRSTMPRRPSAKPP